MIAAPGRITTASNFRAIGSRLKQNKDLRGPIPASGHRM